MSKSRASSGESLNKQVLTTPVRRLNWGCGRHPAPGWINADRNPHEGVQILGDIRAGIPLEDRSIDYIVSIHALPEVPYPDLIGVLNELRRVLETGGVLRLALPDLDKGIRAYLNRNRDHFLVPDEDESTLSGKFIVHMLWYGHIRTLFNSEFAEVLLLRAGFTQVHHCSYRTTRSGYPEIVELDDREEESLFIEAVK